MKIYFSKMKFLALILMGFFALETVAVGTMAQVTSDNQASISDDGLGVQLKFDKDGGLLSVKSTYSHPVEFPDRRGISKAYIIAEEKAKANIARFLNQTVSTARITSELDESQSQSNRSRSKDGEVWSKDNSRKVTESIKEITTSGASALLRGVRIIERSYSEKSEEVTVVVGINRESESASRQLQNGISAGGSASSGKSSPSGSGFPSFGSEKQRSKDFDKF